MGQKKVVVFNGDDASPEVMIPTVEILKSLDLSIEFDYPLIGQEAIQATGENFPAATRGAIDEADATFFGSTSGQSTAALFYLRCRVRGARSSLISSGSCRERRRRALTAHG